MGHEERRSRRLIMRLEVLYVIDGTSKKGTALTNDVSGTGVRFVAEHDLPVGMRLQLRLLLPDRAQPIACVGDVVRSQPSQKEKASSPSEVGVVFVDLVPADRKLLEQYAIFFPEAPET